MKIITLNCPICDKKIKFNKNKLLVYCNSCQTHIIIENDKLKKEKIKKLNDILILGNNFFINKEYEKAYDEYEKILFVDYNNIEAIFKIELCNTYITMKTKLEIENNLDIFNNLFQFLHKSNLSFYEIMIIMNKYAVEILNIVEYYKENAYRFYRKNQLIYNDIDNYVNNLFSCLKILEYIYYNYELNLKNKVDFGILILKLIDDIMSEKQYIDFPKIGKKRIAICNLYKKNKNFLEKRFKKHRDELLRICPVYNNGNNGLKKQRLFLLLSELFLINLILISLFFLNDKKWSIFLFVDFIWLLYDFLNDEIIQNNKFFLIIKIIILFVSIVGLCIN